MSAACRNAGGKATGITAWDRSMPWRLESCDGVKCRYAKSAEAGITLTICTEADEHDRFERSSGQSGTLSTEANNRHSPTRTESSFSHLDARVSGLYLPPILACSYPSTGYSYRRASIGSSRAARSAGRKPEINPTISSMSVEVITAKADMER